MVIMSPKDEHELRDMIKTAIYHEGPAAVRYPKDNGRGGEWRDPEILPIGKGEVLREGHDVALVALGPLVWNALEAADQLSRQGISAAVINARFAKPLDTELIGHWAERTGRIVTVEDGVVAGGFGSAVLEWLAASGMTSRVQVRLLGVPDRFIEHGSNTILHRLVGLDADGIAAATAAFVRGAPASPRRRQVAGRAE